MNLLNLILTSSSSVGFEKTAEVSVADGAIFSIVAIVLVFAILLIIIGVTTLVFKMLGLFQMKAEIDEFKKNGGKVSAAPAATAAPKAAEKVVINDDDMMAAVLVATIDYRTECKKDVKVVSVREVK